VRSDPKLQVDRWKDPWTEYGLTEVDELREEHQRHIEDLRARMRDREQEMQATQQQLSLLQEELRAAKAELARRNDKPREVEESMGRNCQGELPVDRGLPERLLELGKANKDLWELLLGRCAAARWPLLQVFVHDPLVTLKLETDEKDANAGAWTRVPTWDGSPQTWRGFRKEMSWWLAGLDIQSTKKYNLAARWLLRQSGVVRQRGEEFDPRDLEFQKEIKMPNAETGDDEVVVEEDPLSGINKLLTALEEMTGRSSLDKRGELRNVFYLELKRKSGERISEFATRYRGLVAELKAEGVTIHDGELGWWFKQKLGLDPLRTQLLETALAGAEDYPTIEREVLRLFKDLHAADPLYRRSGDADQKAPLLSRFLNQQSGASKASSYAPSMTSSAARSLRSGSSTASSGRVTPSSTYRRPFQKQAMVSEVEEEIPATAEAGDDDGVEEEVEPPSLEEVLTTEAEVLAAELDAAASQGVDPETLQEIEESVEAAAEAFLTMKEARSKLQEVSLKKQSEKHPCFDCGLPGHWAGDPECSKPGQQLGRKKKVAPKQVKVAEALNTEHEEITAPDHEVMMLRHESPVLTDAFLSTVQQFHEPKEVNALGLALDKRLVGALDSACNRTCTGADWLKGYLRGLETSAPSEVLDLVRREPERETFRFGNGGTQVSEERWRLPTMIGGTVVCFWTSVVPVSSLGLLLGRDFLEAIGAVMNFSRKALRCDLTDGTEIPLSQLAAGHYALHLLPERWPGRLRALLPEMMGSEASTSGNKMVNLPHLRYLPLPYPSTGTPDRWLQQGQKQVADGHGCKKHLDLAYTMDRFVYKNLTECGHWRDRMGAVTSFCEDPVVMGMIHGKTAKGLRDKMKNAAMEEALKEAKEAEAAGNKEEMARALIGPRGGLPSLRGDLLKLAALLNVEIKAEDNVETIKVKLRPMVNLLKEKPAPPQSKAKSKAKAAPSKAQGWTVGYSAGLVTEPSPGMVSYQHLIDMRNRFQTTLDSMALEIQELKNQQKEAGNVDLTSLGRSRSASSMSQDPVVDQSLREDAAQSLENAYEDHLMAYYGTSALHLLTREDRQRATLIAQAWAQHESDRKRISQEPRKIRQILEAEYYQDMEHFMNDETFFQHIDLHPHSNDVHVNEAVTGKRSNPLLTEVYTTAQNVSKVAVQRGHHVGQAMSLETGWNFLRADHRALAKEKIQKEKPFCLVLAFPCGPFSPLQHLNARGQKTWPQRLEDGRTLMRFALELAKLQLKEKRHCILENPKPSAAWKEPEMRKFIEENDVHEAAFDQCRFGLMNLDGQLHRKATVVASSSPLVVERLHGMCCRRDHDHAQVIGGSKVTAHAGIYPLALARAFVRGIEDQFDKDHKAYELLAVDVGGNEEEDSHPAVHDVSEDEDDEYQLQPSEANMTIPAAIKAAIKRLHENTGHRSNRRLARALTLAGAPVEAIVAAKRHKCDVCRERAPPKLKRPASLPSPKDFGDQVHIDLLEVEDGREQKYVVAHCTDAATKYQAAEILPNKSTAAVIEFLSKRWVPAFGPPRVLVCDQGREFISWEMEEWASSMSVMLHHVAVQAPWQNGIAEKSGGVLKTLMSAIVTSKSVVTKDEMEMALGEAVAAYNGDVDGESGCSPYQAVLGRQPRMVGDVLGGVQQRLSEHGLIESKPSLARQVALREVAKLAMTRLHFSRGLRRAELARSRSSTVENAPKPGTVCYFYRPLRYNSKTGQSKKKLTLKRWHGPAMMVAQDGHASAFLSYKGQLTKCALEHVRVASTMEQIASGAWGEAIKEAVEDAKYEVALRQPLSDANTPEEPGPPPLPVLPETTAEGVNPRTPAFLPSSTEAMPAEENQLDGEDLPPVKPQELWQMMVPSSSPVTSQVASTLPSRRVSDFSESPFPETTRKAFSRKSSGLPLETVRERAKMLDDRSETGQKRPADVDIDQLRDQEQGHSSAAAASGSGAAHDTLLGERLTPTEIADELGRDDLHPLRKAYLLAEQDKRDPLEAMVPDHGTWHGKWTLPSRSEWQARQNLGLDWPTGDSTEAEVLAVQANRKEFRWKTMSETEKEAFKEAARQAWAVWEENDAVEILTPEESSRVRRRLAGAHEGSKILTPRYVFTDKHEGLRTAENPLPLRARARVIVPGYKDVFSYSLRKDAPTGSRVAQHLLFTFTASYARASKESKKLWRLMSADVKSAFLKGDAYVDGQRELFLENVRGDDPKLPFGNALAKIRKGVFGLADAPRQWYLRLNRSLQAAGIILSHVDDLLLGGNVRAQNSLLMIGQELGFGSVEYDDFVYCGKRVQMKSDGSVVINMQAYHENLRPMEISLARRKTPEAELTEQERRQLRAVLGSLQWLVAQVRFDQGYALSTLQGEKPLVGTLIKANQLVKEFKRRPNFSLTFQPMNLGGGSEGEPHEKHYSQSAYFVIVADQDLMSGKEGVFNVIDARSHRLPRVCRSTYGAELMGVEEGMDMGIFCRGALGAFLGLPMGRRDALKVMEVIPMVAITDAKDTYDRGNSDCPTYGAQKSMAFSVCWIRQVLNGSNSHLKWTATANMWVDAGTKLMPCDHMQGILEKGRWSFVYHQDYVKQSPKKKGAAEVSEGAVLPGEPMDTKAPLFQFILNLSNHAGWHEKDNVIVHVACAARSFRVPDARYGGTKYPFRSTFARFDLKDGRSVWRTLEQGEDLREMAKRQALLPLTASCLVSIFLSQATKNVWQLKKSAVG
ncbi:unnamed protein product, partial [Durusdinium trenchii]